MVVLKNTICIIQTRSFISVPHFFAFFAGDGPPVLLFLPGFPTFAGLDFGAFTDFVNFFGVATFFEGVFLTAAGFLAEDEAAFLAGATFSSVFLVAGAGALRTFTAAFGDLGDFVSGFEDTFDTFVVFTGLAAVTVLGDFVEAAPFASLDFAGLFAVLVVVVVVALGALVASFVTSFIPAAAGVGSLGAFVGFLSSSESLKEFLTLYTLPCFVMFRSWTDKIFLKFGGNPVL
jgi:hypothetical protein